MADYNMQDPKATNLALDQACQIIRMLGQEESEHADWCIAASGLQAQQIILTSTGKGRLHFNHCELTPDWRQPIPIER